MKASEWAGIIECISSICTRLEADREGVLVTAGAIEELRQYIAANCQTDVTLDGAWQAWQIAERLYTRQIRACRFEALIRHYYAVDPATLDNGIQLGLWLNIPAIRAQRVLDCGQFDPADHEFVYAKVFAATGSERDALKARAAAMELAIARKEKHAS